MKKYRQTIFAVTTTILTCLVSLHLSDTVLAKDHDLPDMSIEAAKITILFQAKAGDRFELRIKKNLRNQVNGKVIENVESLFLYDGKVTAVIPGSGYQMKWTIKSVEVPGGDADAGTSLLSLLRDVPIVFETNMKGTPIRILDYKKFLDQAISNLKQSEETDEKSLAIVRSTLSRLDEKTAAMTLLPEAMLLASTQHKRMQPGVTLKNDVYLPNPLGGPPIRSIYALTLVKVDQETGIADYSWTSHFDPDSVQESVAATFNNIIKAKGGITVEQKKQLDQILASYKIDRFEEGAASVSIIDGWTRELTYHREIISQAENFENRKNENWHIEVIKN